MSRERQKELTAAYKELKTRPGVFIVRCIPSGEVWVFQARNLQNRQSGVWFSLRQGSHRHTAMQAAWKAHGETAFVYEELEAIDAEDLASWQVAERLKALEAEWRAKLGAT